MAWAKLDDGFHRNDKQLRMSDAAFRVYVCSMSYCADVNEPTGFLTHAQAAALLRSLGKRPPVVRELVGLNAWEEVADGYLIHDYEVYLPKSSTERVRRWREMKRTGNVDVTRYTDVAVKRDETLGNAHGNASHVRAPDGYPVPDPVPVPQGSPTSNPDPPTPHRGAVTVLTPRFTDDYTAFLATLSQAVGRRFRGDAVSRKLYVQRRQDGRTAEDLLAAARGVALSAHHMGLNDNGIPYNGPANVLRSKALDTLIGLGTGEIDLTRRATRDEQSSADIAEWARRKEAERGALDA